VALDLVARRWSIPVGTAPLTGHGRYTVVGGLLLTERDPDYSDVPSYLYDAQADTWIPTPATGIEERAASVFAAAGDRLVYWGGSRPVSGDLQKLIFPDAMMFGDGVVFNPANRTWAAMAMEGAPSPRARPVVAATAHEVFVWGGFGKVRWGGAPAEPWRDGAIYDVATNRWRSASTVGAPDARAQPVSLLTGGGLVVWGGNRIAADGSDGGRANDGAVYDLKQNTWTPIGPAPSALPGGSGYAAYPTTGGDVAFVAGETLGALLHLSERRWETLDLAGGPVGRSQPLRAWTGRHLVVWGGATLRTMGCENVPPGVGCDPIAIRDFLNGGFVYAVE
jgi:hypothetical protein